jgi:hypothetical protein
VHLFQKAKDRNKADGKRKAIKDAIDQFGVYSLLSPLKKRKVALRGIMEDRNKY